MFDTSPVLVLIATIARWALAIGAALAVFLVYRWSIGPEMGLFGLIFGCALFAAVAMLVLRLPRRAQQQ